MEEKQKAKHQILYLLKMYGPQSAAELAEQLQVSPMAIRQHLKTLKADLQVTYEEDRRPLGRPVKLWQLTERSADLFPNAHADLMVDMLHNVEKLFGASALENVLAERAKQQVETYSQVLAEREGDRDRGDRQSELGRRVRHLAEIRDREGYMARAIAREDGSFLLVENHCPIQTAAHTCQLLCHWEMKVFQTLLGPEVSVERVEHIMEGDRRCAYAIALNPKRPSIET
jgi:predicted ArsR family transcriptional regulator